MRTAAAAWFLVAAGGLMAQDAPATFQSTTELVLLDVQVLHVKTRTSTASLRPSDLLVSEDGVPQEIRSFSRDEAPLSVVLLFDLTESVRGVLKRLAEGAASALAHLKPEDEVAVMVYAAQARLVDDFTTDRARTVRSIWQAIELQYDEPAHFNEAMYQSSLRLRQSANPSSRRVVIWLTDNLPNVPYRKNFPAHTEKEATRMLHEDGVVVSPILLKDAVMVPIYGVVSALELPWRKSHPPGDAHKYAEITGGVATGLRGKNVDERLAEVIDDLRARYVVGYRPNPSKPAGAFCKVRVELAPNAALRRREWAVLARQGYYRK
jgi:VWFA-related protein